MPNSQEITELKLQLRLAPESSGSAEERFSPSGSDAAVMWAHGLGSTQTTPSTSAQAVPAPIAISQQVNRGPGGRFAFKF
jgi:hypothetical protein